MKNDLYELLRKLLEDLDATGEITGEEPDELAEIIDVFCKHRRVLRVLLQLCEE